MYGVPDHFKKQEMCNKAVEDEPETLEFVPDNLKTKTMCERAIEKGPYNLKFIPDHFKTQEICGKMVRGDPRTLLFVTDWFVTREGVAMCYNNSEYCDDEDNFFKWYEGYKKRRAQKASIKEELSPIAWHPSRYWDWCMSEDEKKETEKLWA